MDSVLPYTYHRIKAIFKEDYGYSLERIFIYKGGRYGQPLRYKLVDSYGETIVNNTTLDALRAYLTSEGYTLHKNE